MPERKLVLSKPGLECARSQANIRTASTIALRHIGPVHQLSREALPVQRATAGDSAIALTYAFRRPTIPSPLIGHNPASLIVPKNLGAYITHATITNLDRIFIVDLMISMRDGKVESN